MKKATLLLVSLVLALGIFAVLPAAAEESDMYYTNVTILKIYPHSLGYYIIYRKPAGLGTAEFFVPKEWLDRRDSRAVLNLTDQNISPYCSIITKKGEFDHIRITAAKDISDPTWGTLDSGVPYNDKFKVDKLVIQY
jgi:hypothetical protein